MIWIIPIIILVIVVAGVKIIPQSRSKVVERLGSYHATLQTGVHYVIPFIDRVANDVSLKEIVKDGLISSWFIEGRGTKYPSSVGVWNLRKDYPLKEYINFYSGGTVKYFNQLDNNKETEVISFSDISTLVNKVIEKGYLAWKMEQTKEARWC